MQFMAWVTVALVAALAAPAAAQIDEHRGSVIIRSTAADALTSKGGIVSESRLSATSDNPLYYSNETDGPSDEKKWRWLGFAGDLYLQTENDAGSSTATALQITRTGTTVNQFLFPSGTAGAPAVAFQSDTDTGLFLAAAGRPSIAADGAQIIDFRAAGSGSGVKVYVNSNANGSGANSGSFINIGRNSSGNGAPGALSVVAKNGSVYSFYPDSTGKWRTGTGDSGPTEAAGDSTDQVVGDQTSNRAAKNVLAEITNTAAAMAIVRATPVYQFTYKDGRYNGETFYGIITDESPLFGMDHGRSFNPLTSFGATVLALRDLDARLLALEARR